jgi:hypothetical protein
MAAMSKRTHSRELRSITATRSPGSSPSRRIASCHRAAPAATSSQLTFTQRFSGSLKSR